MPTGKYKRTLYHNINISESLKGIKFTSEWREKISIANKGKKAQGKAVEGEIVDKKYPCTGCDIGISASDKEFSEKVSKDGKPYCVKCLNNNRK